MHIKQILCTSTLTTPESNSLFIPRDLSIRAFSSETFSKVVYIYQNRDFLPYTSRWERVEAELYGGQNYLFTAQSNEMLCIITP